MTAVAWPSATASRAVSISSFCEVGGVVAGVERDVRRGLVAPLVEVDVLVLQGVGQFVGQHGFLLVDADPVEHIHGLGLGVVVGLDLLFQQGQQKGLEVEIAIEQSEFLEHDLAALHALGVLVVVELLIQIAFHGGAGGEPALDLALDGQAGLLRGELEQFVDQSEELLGLFGCDVGFGLGTGRRRGLSRCAVPGVGRSLGAALGLLGRSDRGWQGILRRRESIDSIRFQPIRAVRSFNPPGGYGTPVTGHCIQYEGYNQDAVWRAVRSKKCAMYRKRFPMTQPDLAATISATPLAALLASAAKPPRLLEYRGAMTPRQLDAPATETAALVSGAAVHDLGWMRRVAVRGEDRFRWLSGMVTNMVNDLAPDGGAWNLVLNAQGRIQGDLTVWREGDGLELGISADQFERLLTHLEHFIIMDDVELVQLGLEPGGAETALGLTGPLAGEMLGRMGLPTLGEPMTGTRVEWNGLNLRILRGYGALCRTMSFGLR